MADIAPPSGLAPASPFLAERYLTAHGPDAPHSDRARWTLERFHAGLDWHPAKWLAHLREHRDAGLRAA